jgi:hypothetical protein
MGLDKAVRLAIDDNRLAYHFWFDQNVKRSTSAYGVSTPPLRMGRFLKFLPSLVVYFK